MDEVFDRTKDDETRTTYVVAYIGESFAEDTIETDVRTRAYKIADTLYSLYPTVTVWEKTETVTYRRMGRNER